MTADDQKTTKTDILISVVIPWHRNEDMLSRAIHSVASTNDDGKAEIIIVCNGEASNKVEFVKTEYAEVKNLVVLSTPVGHACIARNLGADNARGEIVAYLDVDDEFLPRKLTKIEQVYEDSEAVYFSKGVRIFPNGTKTIFPYRSPGAGEPIDEYIFCHGNYLSSSALFLSTKAAREIRFTDNLAKNQDLDFIVRAWQRGYKVIFEEEPLYIYHDELNEGRVSRTSGTEVQIRWGKELLSEPAFYGFLARGIAQHEFPRFFFQNSKRFFAAWRYGNIPGYQILMMVFRGLLPITVRAKVLSIYTRWRA